MTRPAATLSLLCLCLGLGLGLGACAPNTVWDGRPPASQIEVDDKPTVLVLPVTASRPGPGGRLDDGQREQLRQALATVKSGQIAAVDIRFPPSLSAAAGAPLLLALDDLGVPANRVRTATADAHGNNRDIVVTVHALTTHVKPCDALDRAELQDERPLAVKQYSIGCISATNLAAMVADPRDLTGPRHLAPEDGQNAVKPIQKLLTTDSNSSVSAAAAAQKTTND
ncbi:MAG: CpaD family pilus assembly lipoprotein [Azospirillaceae bacterium]|nr:CpaD family pilus assembly lipoprotein [Azospirillaceae bacterium]